MMKQDPRARRRRLRLRAQGGARGPRATRPTSRSSTSRATAWRRSRRVAELQPDVVTLDLVMPELDGLGVLQGAAQATAAPRVVVVSSSDADSELGIAALEPGAVDLVDKPTALATQRIYEMADRLVAIGAHRRRGAPARRNAPSRADFPGHAPSREAHHQNRTRRDRNIHRRTPGADARCSPRCPPIFRCPSRSSSTCPPGYTESLARRLDELSALDVREAYDGQLLVPGLAVIARAGAHLRIRREAGQLAATSDFLRARGELHQPSVDVLFTSAAAHGRVACARGRAHRHGRRWPCRRARDRRARRPRDHRSRKPPRWFTECREQ